MCYAAPAAGREGQRWQQRSRQRLGQENAWRSAAREAEAAPPAAPERRFIGIDPWAVLLEQLMEVPEEEPAERKGGKRE